MNPSSPKNHAVPDWKPVSDLPDTEPPYLIASCVLGRGLARTSCREGFAKMMKRVHAQQNKEAPRRHERLSFKRSWGAMRSNARTVATTETAQ